ncbi:NAD(P)/FAD-dependent oxidoreductase [Zhongshania marina]|uniref:Pyridine nucleotide-disulfide oxidoreductase n=1 Tax=Zhongshania marina TaxID=2304603 RepID=A0A2S4HKR2_9GAMM|nr:FAD-dependent oxidoreductase [Marortus luteolus]POP54470.1 pyridine nucleotide-disulfide oxidoreductase [Marortus luteolus]
MEKHCVIIGGSHAAAMLAASLRQEGWEGMISIVGADPTPPYHRPPLSKGALNGDKSDNDLLIRPAEFYEKNNIDLVLGCDVAKIDRNNKKVILHDGAEIAYTRLALTTGAKVRKIPIPGSGLEGVCYLRDLRDAHQIRKFIGSGKSAVVIGGGYIGLEAAASMRKMGMNVTVLEAQPRVLARVTSPEISAFYTRVHNEEGTQVLTDVSIEQIEGEKFVSGVRLANGRVLPADIVLIGVGVLPATELAEAAGLEVDNGIVVDEFARTSDHDIVAAGDCTRHYNPIYDTQLRLESVQNANDQAKVAAKTLCGKLEAYRALPWFWSDQYDLKLQIAGFSAGFDNVVLRGDATEGRSFAAFYFKGDKLLAVDAINRPKEFMLAKRFLAEGKTADPGRIVDESVDLNDIF